MAEVCAVLLTSGRLIVAYCMNRTHRFSPLNFVSSHSSFLQAVDTIHLEIFDERAFAVDDRIAWTDIVISPQMLDGTMTDTIDDWYAFRQKQNILDKT